MFLNIRFEITFKNVYISDNLQERSLVGLVKIARPRAYTQKYQKHNNNSLIS